MRAFLAFLMLFAAAALLSGLLTYPAWWLLQLFIDAPLHRVMNRLGMLLLAGLTVLWLRRRGLANKAALGYDLPRPQFTRQMLFGWIAGVLLMMPLVMALFGFDVRDLSNKFATSDTPAWWVAKLALRGVFTGVTVAFLEETFCRGAMFTAISRESGLWLAMLLPSLLYAATHFLGGQLRIAPEDTTYASGLDVAANLFERFAEPLAFADSFMALLALGILLSLIRWRTGTVAGSIGLHAGGVAVIVTLRGISTLNAQHPHAWMVGSYDGVIGWLACAWIGVVALGYAWWTRSKISD
jgi:uncharacterized protein